MSCATLVEETARDQMDCISVNCSKQSICQYVCVTVLCVTTLQYVSLTFFGEKRLPLGGDLEKDSAHSMGMLIL